MKKLRIAMFMSSNPHIAGGVQEHVLHLSKELRKSGHTVTLFGPKLKNTKFPQYKGMGEKVYFLLPNGSHSNFHLLNEFDKPQEKFIREKYDILHIHEPYTPFAAWTVLEKSTVPITTTFHSIWDNQSIYNIFNPIIPVFKDKFSLYVKGAIFVSKIAFEKWRLLCDKSVIKQIIPNAVDISLFKPKKTINKKVRLLFVARIVKRKGLLRLLRAIKLLTKKKIDFTLTVVGDGDEKNSDMKFVYDNKLTNYVQFLGEINGNKRAKYFKNADIFCAPYINEAASISILEAVSSGLPIVGYKIPIFSDLLNDYPGKEFLVEKTDSALAHTIEKIISNPLLIQHLKEWCLKKRETFSWATMAKQTEDVYYNVLSKMKK